MNLNFIHEDPNWTVKGILEGSSIKISLVSHAGKFRRVEIETEFLEELRKLKLEMHEMKKKV